MRRRMCWLVAVSCLFAAAGDAKDDAVVPSFNLDVLAASSQEVSLTVPPSGTIPLRILRGGGAVPGGEVELSLSQFVGSGGASVTVRLTVEGAGQQAPATQALVPFGSLLLPVHLEVPRFPTPGEYTGTLTLTFPGQAQATVWKIKLTASQELRPATLVLDQGPVSLTATRATCLWWGRRGCLGVDEVPAVEVHVRDKTGGWPLDGVVARLEPGLTAPKSGFDPQRNLRASFDGRREDIFAAPPPGGRLVPAGGQATVRLEFVDLKPGAYSIPLRLTAGNSGADDLQKLTFTIQVRDGIGWPIIVLALASLASFVATRVVTTLRSRSAFLQRVAALRPAWLSEEPPVLPVIWLRAMVRLTEELSRRYWLTSQAEIDARLTEVGRMLPVLDRVRQLRARFSQQIGDELIRNRALWALEDVVSRIGAGPLSEQQAAQRVTELDAMEAWLDPLSQEATYWADLVRAIRRLLSQARPETLNEPGRTLVAGLAEALRDATAPPTAGGQQPPPLTLKQKMDVERKYQRLRITWDLRHTGEPFGRVLDLQQKPDPAVADMFRVIDSAAWDRLKSGKGKPVVEVPQKDTMDPLETYAPITFKLATPNDPTLVETFLMKHKLTYKWTLDITSRHGVESVGKLPVTSSGPRIAQYTPRAGRVTVERVEIRYGSEEGPTVENTPPVEVRRSRDFRIWQIASAADVLALVVAFAVALVSGLLVYLGSATFGAAKDYILLFLWGAGMDQGKNFIQAMATKVP